MPAVNVRKDPVMLTTVHSILYNDVDPCWFQMDIEDFEPYKATQIAPSKIVIQMPKCPYNFLFGVVLDCNGDYESEDISSAFLLNNTTEQKELDILRNHPKVEDPKT